MAHLLSEDLKLDTAYVPTASLNGDNTGPYFLMQNWRRALFVVHLGAMAAGVTSQLRLYQAKTAAGGSAKAVTGIDTTITANVKAEVVTLTLASVLVDHVVQINGLTYTAAAAADLPNRVFSQAGTDAQDAASLAAAINHATAGVPGITATDLGNGTIRLAATVHGETTVTIGTVSATITPATVQASGLVEITVGMLDLAGGFNYVALRITNSAATPTAATLIRGDGRYNAVQQVAAQDVVV